MRNEVQLITYADRLAGDLPGLIEMLDGPLDGLFGGVHVLPFYTPFDGADAGFDPDDHTSVDPRLGSWQDIARLAERHDVMADLIVNHVSSRSREFRDWLVAGEESPYDGMFLTPEDVFPGGPSPEDTARIYRPRPGAPFTMFRVAGSDRLVWTTFTGHQVDIDVNHPMARRYLLGVLDRMAESGVTIVRLDAVGYAIKTPGTSSFMTPETFDFIDELSGWCAERGLEVLVEIHSHHEQQIDIARRVDYVYDFALPPLVLHALATGRADSLARWLEIRPRNAVTVLDTHDGIGVVDVGASDGRPGLLDPDEIHDLVETIHENSEGTSRLATGTAASNVDLYQVNCTYYDALARDDDAYLVARALQFFTPGIPQVYYVGLFAGGNDVALLDRTGIGRDVNRHHYSSDEIRSALATPVVASLTDLIGFRNTHPAFGGDFSWSLEDTRLSMTWTADRDEARLTIDVERRAGVVAFTASDGARAEVGLWEVPSTP